MNGFLGTYMVSLDNKGRINCPAKYKAILERQEVGNLVISVMENYLTVYPQSEWTLHRQRETDDSAKGKQALRKRRKFYPRTDESEMKSGKILIPAKLRQIHGLDKEVVLVGMLETFEIWTPANWEKEQAELDAMPEE